MLSSKIITPQVHLQNSQFADTGWCPFAAPNSRTSLACLPHQSLGPPRPGLQPLGPEPQVLVLMLQAPDVPHGTCGQLTSSHCGPLEGAVPGEPFLTRQGCPKWPPPRSGQTLLNNAYTWGQQNVSAQDERTGTWTKLAHSFALFLSFWVLTGHKGKPRPWCSETYQNH